MCRFLHRCALLPVALACTIVAAVAGVASLPATAHALPPAQTILSLSTEAPLTESTTLSVAVYGWAVGRDKALGVYAGPGWSFLDDKLSVYLRGGGYISDLATPLINFELYYENGNYNLDLFNDFFYLGESGNPGGVYSWLSGQYWWKGLYFGAMADMTKDKASFQLNAGPVIGFGNKKLSLGLAPIYSINDPKDADRDGLGVRVLVDVEFEADEDKPCEGKDGKPCDDCEGKDGAKKEGDKKDDEKADEKKDDDKKADDKKADDKKEDDKKEDDKKDDKKADDKPAEKAPGKAKPKS